MLDRVGIRGDTQLLDVGCGPGGAAVLAAARGARVAGLDISQPPSTWPPSAFQMVISGSATMESLPWTDGFFHAVIGFKAFQFARNRVASLREARRVLHGFGRLGIVVWAPREQSQQPRVMAATSALAPSQPPDAPGPFALFKPGVLESALESARFKSVAIGGIPIEAGYPDGDTACKAMMARSAGVRAVQHSGEERVKQSILQALEEYRSDTGGYRMANRFRFVIAE